jgi:hypothetical protein
VGRVQQRGASAPSRNLRPLCCTLQQDTGRPFPPSIRQISLLHMQDLLHRCHDNACGCQAGFLRQTWAKSGFSMVPLFPSQLRPLSYRRLPCTASSALWRGHLAYRCQAYLYLCRGDLAAYVVNVIARRQCAMGRADRPTAVCQKKSALKPSLSLKEGLSAPGKRRLTYPK